MSIKQHVNFSISLITTSTAEASFGTPIFVAEHSITADRQNGPYYSLDAVAAAGFTLVATPTIYNAAAAVFAQRPRAQGFMVGRRLAAEHIAVTMNAIKAANPASFFAVLLESRSTVDILGLITWIKTESKIAVMQSSDASMLTGTASTAQASTFTFAGTATDGDYSIEVTDSLTGAVLGTATVTRDTGTPATHADLATAMRAAWDGVPALAAISAAAGGAGDDVDIDFSDAGALYTFTLSAPGPGTLTLTDTPGIQNLGELGSALAPDNAAVIYHPNDTHYLDAAWAGRCLGFNLDAENGSGSWAHHTPVGVVATRILDADQANLRAYNVNQLSPLTYTSGVEEEGFTFDGRALSGQTLKVTTSLFWLEARLEEALLKVFLEVAKSASPAILYTPKGIALFQTSAMGVFTKFLTAGHGVAGISPSTKRQTPYVDVPTPDKISAVDKAGSRLTQLTAEAIVAPEILSIGDPSTVGFTIELRQ